MPILSPTNLKPQIQEALKVAGLQNSKSTQNSSPSSEGLESLLSDAGLGAPEVLNQLATLMVYSEQENTRLGAAKIALQLNRLLDSDETKQVPIVNIIINDSEYTQINPILLPR